MKPTKDQKRMGVHIAVMGAIAALAASGPLLNTFDLDSTTLALVMFAQAAALAWLRRAETQ